MPSTGVSAVHFAASAKASSALHEPLMMTPDHEPAFVFSDWPAGVKVAARRIANAPAHACLFIVDSSPARRLDPNLGPSTISLGLRIRSRGPGQHAGVAI